MATNRLAAAFLFTLAGAGAAQSTPSPLRFDFMTGPERAGYTKVSASTRYDDVVGYGFEAGTHLASQRGEFGPASERPILFSAKVPEGNFDVTVALGGCAAASSTTVEAESGRLMLERINVPASTIVERTFTTNVRTPDLPKLPLSATGREQISLDQFDRGNQRDWDHKLTIKFTDAGLQVEVQHFAEKMLHGQNVSAVECGGAYRAPGAEG